MKPVPWIGTLPASWLDEWCREAGDGDGRALIKGRATLRKLSDAAVEACKKVWTEAGKM